MAKLLFFVALLAAFGVQATVPAPGIQKEFWCGETALCYDKSAVCAVEYCTGPPTLGSCVSPGPGIFEVMRLPVRNRCCQFKDPKRCFRDYWQDLRNSTTESVVVTATFTGTPISVPTTGATINTAASLTGDTFIQSTGGAGSPSSSSSSVATQTGNAAATAGPHGCEALYLAGGMALAALL